MKTFKTTLTLAALIALPFLAYAQDDGKSIYGNDDRKDFFEMSAPMQALADSVVSFWKAGSVEALNPGGVKLKTMNFGERLNLCPGEKFREQPIGAFCSGSLVGEDLVMTAGHCVKNETDCQNTKLVFGFGIKKAGAEATTTMPASEVYSCAKIVKRFLGGEPGSANPAGQNLGADFALIKLDRKVTNHKPLGVARVTSLKKGEGIFVIGHPVGLPVKLAGFATVRDFSKIGYFTADLDTFGGNSGSPVFSVKTKKIEGILVRGDEDFSDSPAGCTTQSTYEQTGGRGEDVTKIGVLAADIPGLPGEKITKEMEMQKAVDMDMSGLNAVESAPVKTVSFD
jgi:V8-like Glu-specific endopeptidase